MTLRQELLNMVVETLSASPATIKVFGGEFAMEPAGQLVGYRAKFDLPGQWTRLDVSTASARPPFEWVGEITVDSANGLNHWLIRDEDVVRAERKVLTPLTELETQEIIKLMHTLQAELRNSPLWQPNLHQLSLSR